MEMVDRLHTDHAKELLIDHYKSNLYDFTKHCLGYNALTETCHKPICNVLEEDTKRKLLCLPRGTFKSTIACVAYPIWRLMHDPDCRILISSEVFTNSKNFLREIKMQVKGEHFRYLFGDWEGESGWGQHEIVIAHRTAPHKEASVTAGGIETQKVGQHYDMIILDDLSSPSNTNTPENQQKVIDFYKYQTSILEPNGTIVVIGTRYAVNDVIGHILENEVDGWNADGTMKHGQTTN